MTERQDEWRFLRLRAAQLMDEGNTAAALKLLQSVNREQIRKFEQLKYERMENC